MHLADLAIDCIGLSLQHHIFELSPFHQYSIPNVERPVSNKGNILAVEAYNVANHP
jgi:hypothetical protein